MGERTGQLLANHFGSLDKLAQATREELVEAEEVGPRVAEAIQEFFQEKRNREVIEKLRQAGLQFEQEQTRKTDGKLAGKQFVLTGTLPTYSRDQAKQMIEDERRARGGFRQQEDRLRGGGRRRPAPNWKRRALWALRFSMNRAYERCWENSVLDPAPKFQSWF